MSWRRKTTSVPTSLAMAVTVAGSIASETAGIGREPGGGATQSIAQSLASVAEPPLPKMMSLPPRREPLVDGERRLADALGFARAPPAPRSAASSATFIRIDAATCADQVGRRLLLAAEERIEEPGLADVVAQLAVLEEDVHRLPERVVQDLDQLLVHERILGRRRDRVRALRRRAARRSWRRAPAARRERRRTSGSPSGGPKPMTMSSGRTSASSQGPNSRLRVERRERALADDDGVHELHRHVLRVGGVGSAAEGEQPAAAEEALRHLAARRPRAAAPPAAKNASKSALRARSALRPARREIAVAMAIGRSSRSGAADRPTSMSTIRLPP